MKVFKDRKNAGKLLAKSLKGYTGRSDVFLLCVTTGSLPVAYEVSLALKVLCDIFFVVEMPLPGQEKFSLGAVTSGEHKLINNEVVHGLKVPEQVINIAYFNSLYELKKKEFHFRGGLPAPALKNKQVIIISDGLEPDRLLRAGLSVIRGLKPHKIVLAAPVINQLSYEFLRQETDEVISLYISENTNTPVEWYSDLSEPSDRQIINMLKNIRYQPVSENSR